MFNAATAAEKEQRKGGLPQYNENQMGLQRLLFSLFNDEGLAGLSNPELMASATKRGVIDTQDGFTQGQITRGFRQAQTGLTAEGLRKPIYLCR